MLGLSCRGQPFSRCGGGGWGGAALRLRRADVSLRSVPSLVAARGLENLGSVVRGMDLVALRDVAGGMWDLPKPGVEPALAGGFLATGPPRNSLPTV